MKTLVLTQAHVEALLSMPECIDVMQRTFAAAVRGEVVNPLRRALVLPDRSGLLGMMPAYLAEIRALGIKVLSVQPGNHGTPYDTHQGAVLLFEPDHGRLAAILDASSLTAIRTAAVSALATRLLARADAQRLAILGSGVQARSHLEAIRVVKALAKVLVWSRNERAARGFAEREAARLGVGIEVAATARDAVATADIICTTTSAHEPVLLGEWLRPGTHINAVGACMPRDRELDTEAVLLSRLFVDSRESALNEAGDFLIPKRAGELGDEHILGELGDLLAGKLQGREDAGQITCFKSLGIGIEDVGAANYVYEKALREGAGLRFDLGGRRA